MVTPWLLLVACAGQFLIPIPSTTDKKAPYLNCSSLVRPQAQCEIAQQDLYLLVVDHFPEHPRNVSRWWAP